MRDHRPDLDPDAPKQRDITEQVHQHHTKHPGSVRRSDKNKARLCSDGVWVVRWYEQDQDSDAHLLIPARLVLIA